MNIQEAIKSGKKFRRAGLTPWLEEGDFHIQLPGNPSDAYLFSTGDILATDWEVEEKKVEITKGQLADAWDRKVAGRTVVMYSNASGIFEEICKELGL